LETLESYQRPRDPALKTKRDDADRWQITFSFTTFTTFTIKHCPQVHSPQYTVQSYQNRVWEASQ